MGVKLSRMFTISAYTFWSLRPNFQIFLVRPSKASSNSCINETFNQHQSIISFHTRNDAVFHFIVNILFSFKYVFLSISSSVINLTIVIKQCYYLDKKSQLRTRKNRSYVFAHKRPFTVFFPKSNPYIMVSSIELIENVSKQCKSIQCAQPQVCIASGVFTLIFLFKVK